MIRLTSARQALNLRGTIPELAVQRMVHFEGKDGRYNPKVHGYIMVIQERDDISKIPEVGPRGLFEIIDSERGSFDYVEAFDENGRTIYEIVIPLDNDRTLALILPDGPWLDQRLRSVLESETNRRFLPLPKGELSC
ncbi:hypothetical protein [Syntrophotalea acetylenica]|uniref:Uncharacterized protein n=1 Tax=Syntrophotalea acetylenica TaxID=29542 RepID=A0A1L3GE69_SYNAC|nr:hypothetical protein [Syntrophotalea acetylenica]APG24244.1 hypothetical protein A7E75_03735 [Syntrophotalea acetylenica]APG44825.1 hypothetical protein A6070_12360 [Syntrophotalea acetylenica]